MVRLVKKCCAFGHRELYRNIDDELKEVIVNLIENEGVTLFMTGGIGQTDGKFSSIVRGLKSTYKQIKLVLVKPYFSGELNTNKDYYEIMYDDVIVPDELAGCHYKSAITKRNRWMIDRCDYIIDCTYRDFGGAIDAIKYAKRIGKMVLEIKK